MRRNRRAATAKAAAITSSTAASTPAPPSAAGTSTRNNALARPSPAATAQDAGGARPRAPARQDREDDHRQEPAHGQRHRRHRRLRAPVEHEQEIAGLRTCRPATARPARGRMPAMQVQPKPVPDQAQARGCRPASRPRRRRRATRWPGRPPAGRPGPAGRPARAAPAAGQQEAAAEAALGFAPVVGPSVSAFIVTRWFLSAGSRPEALSGAGRDDTRCRPCRQASTVPAAAVDTGDRERYSCRHEDRVHRHPRRGQDHALLRTGGRAQAAGPERRPRQGGGARLSAADQPRHHRRRPELDPALAGGARDRTGRRLRHDRLRPLGRGQLRLHGACRRAADRSWSRSSATG